MEPGTNRRQIFMKGLLVAVLVAWCCLLLYPLWWAWRYLELQGRYDRAGRALERAEQKHTPPHAMEALQEDLVRAQDQLKEHERLLPSLP